MEWLCLLVVMVIVGGVSFLAGFEVAEMMADEDD